MNNRSISRNYSPYLDSFIKRSFDITLCLIFLAPAISMLVIIMLAVLIIDGKPVIFMQNRSGKDGKIYLMPKIRTLKNNTNLKKPACCIETPTTRTGGFLRKHRLDELPQIFSVLSGQMSLVGPRPELPGITERYSPKERKRLYPKPGVTGLWQIKASRNQAIHEHLEYDLYYLRKASLWLDIIIIAETIPFVLCKRNDAGASTALSKLSASKV